MELNLCHCHFHQFFQDFLAPGYVMLSIKNYYRDMYPNWARRTRVHLKVQCVRNCWYYDLGIPFPEIYWWLIKVVSLLETMQIKKPQDQIMVISSRVQSSKNHIKPKRGWLPIFLYWNSMLVHWVLTAEVSGWLVMLTGHVGFDSLPDQLVNKSVNKGFAFNILCIGELICHF